MGKIGAGECTPEDEDSYNIRLDFAKSLQRTTQQTTTNSVHFSVSNGRTINKRNRMNYLPVSRDAQTGHIGGNRLFLRKTERSQSSIRRKTGERSVCPHFPRAEGGRSGSRRIKPRMLFKEHWGLVTNGRIRLSSSTSASLRGPAYWTPLRVSHCVSLRLRSLRLGSRNAWRHWLLLWHQVDRSRHSSQPSAPPQHPSRPAGPGVMPHGPVHPVCPSEQIQAKLFGPNQVKEH